MTGPGGMLRALNLFRALGSGIGLNQLVVFLQVAEQEGLSVQDIARNCGLTQSAASRNLRAIGRADADWSLPPALGLVEAFLCATDERRHVIYLTAAGLDLKVRFAASLHEADPVTAADRARRKALRNAYAH